MEDGLQAERLCRICFASEEGESSGPLFRPCACRGSSAWVHMNCLDRWRHSSANPRSFYECDTCKYQYRFGRVFEAYGGADRFTLARLLTSRVSTALVALGFLLTLVFAAGFVAKAFSPELTWWETIACFNLQHLLYGLSLIHI